MKPACVFCRLRDLKEPARLVYEDEAVLAFEDINPQAPVHLLIIPKEHYASLAHIPEEQESLLGRLLLVAAKLAKAKAIDRTGYRLVINTGPDSGQAIFHLHVHLLGGRRFSWPPG